MNEYKPETKGISDPFDGSPVLVLPAKKCGLSNFPANAQQHGENLAGLVNHALTKGYEFNGSFMRQVASEPVEFEIHYCFLLTNKKDPKKS